MKNLLKTVNAITLILLSAYLIKIPLFPGANLPLLDVLLIVASVINFSFLRKTAVTDRQKPTNENLKINWWLGLGIFGLLSPLVIGLFFAPNMELLVNGLGLPKSLFVLPIIYAFSVKSLVKKKFIRLEDIFWWIFLGSALVAFNSLLFLLNQQFTFDHRLQGFYNSPNSLAFILAVGILAGLFLIQKRFFSTKFALAVAGSIILLELFLVWQTASAGALMGILLAILFWQISLRWPKKTKPLLVGLLLGCYLFFVLIINLNWLLAKLNYQPTTPPSSLDSRIAIYQSAEKIRQDHFWLGVGPGSFNFHYLQNQIFFQPYPQWAVPHAHNFLLQLAVEGGTLSLIGLSFIFIYLISRQKNRTGSGALIILVYLLIHGLVDVPMWKNDLAVIFWLMIFLFDQKE